MTITEQTDPVATTPFDEGDPLQLDRMICFPIYVAGNLLMRAYRPLLSAIGLTYPQYLVMLALWDAAPQSVGGLGDRLNLDSGTLTPLLKRLEANGVVVRTRDARDERRVLVSLTDAGRALREHALHIPATLAGAVGLSATQLIAVRDTMQTLVGALDRAAPVAGKTSPIPSP